MVTAWVVCTTGDGTRSSPGSGIACSSSVAFQGIRASLRAGLSGSGALPALAARPLRERPGAGCREKRAEKDARLAAAWGPVMGRPWPQASTSGLSLASAATDFLAAGQSQVEIYGGPETRCLPVRKSRAEFT